MRHFKHIFIILFVLASCSTEMDSDLETAINNGYVSESYNDLPGTLYTGDSTTTTTTKYLYNFEDGVVPSNFSMSGNADWDTTSSTYSSGSYSLKSGSIVHNQTSCVSVTQTTIAGPLVFYYKTSSESSDYLKFYIDGSVNKTASGSTGWTKYVATVSSSGSHIFKWCYEKDSSSSSGSDAVWIDEILMPLEVTTFSSVSAGGSHTCAVDNNSRSHCWGYGSTFQLGNGSTSSQSTPVSVSGISTATSVSAAFDAHTCAVLSGGTVKCWGYNSQGQLGNGTTSTSSTPVSVSNISTATSVSAGGQHTCAVLSGGTVKCWGYGNYGQLGNGSTSNWSTPVSVSNISTATSVSGGANYTCAVLSGGTVKCWGRGSHGQLGNGSTTDQTEPVTVINYTDKDAPTGSVSINNKSSYSTGYKTVSFTLTAADSTAIVGYYFSTSSSTPSSSSSSWTYVSETTSLSETVSSSKYLSSGNNNFYVWYKDVLENISAQYTDSMYCSSSSCY